MEFRVPTDDEMNVLNEKFRYNDEEAKYWHAVCERHQLVPNDTYAVAGFLKGVLADVRQKFPHSSPLVRKAIYEYAKRLERIGTFRMEGHDLRARSDVMLNAADLYLEADEILGFLSDYAFRQLESCGGAIQFREEAGLKDEIVKLGLIERVQKLSAAIFSAIGTNQVTFVNVDSPFARDLRAQSVKCVDDIVKVYEPAPAHPQN